ncbi:MAG: RNA-directed DNA polymerase [Nitrospiraceae bacterium]
MKTTARFELERRRHLKKLFTKDRLIDLWRKLVKEQIRAFDIRDLHDYYDFNYSIEARVEAIIGKVLSGQYRAEVPLVYRMEKKFGICRHLLIPSPSDALVFQLLTDVLYGAIIKAQPSKSAYYARDRHALSLPHEHKKAGSYPWFILWPRFQKEIWNFSKSHRFLVTTDIANYFDAIGLRELRHVISAIAKTKEVYLDLLFSLIENLSWNPDYLPTSHKGLPTINIEAPRLLAHALLFEVDYVLKKRTKDSFVRWMDDINFGVDDLSTANLILGEVNDVLKSRGLALNIAKTEIMTAKSAQHHFLFSENIRLTRLQKRAKRVKSATGKQRLARNTAKELAVHLKTCDARNKDKATKRFINILSILRAPVGLTEVKEIFRLQPSLRGTVLAYLSRLPFTAGVADAFLRCLDNTELYDDTTRFTLVEALVKWQIPFNKEGKSFVRKVVTRIQHHASPFEWTCYVFFLAKYGEPHEVLTVAGQLKAYGSVESFFARQRIAVLPRGFGINDKIVLNQLRREVSTGLGDAASVANNLLGFVRKPFPAHRNREYWYLFPHKPQTPYPVAKFLLLCVLAYSEKGAGRTVMRPEIVAHVTDPWFINWLRVIHPAWF